MSIISSLKHWIPVWPSSRTTIRDGITVNGIFRLFTSLSCLDITPAIKYLNIVIPAKAGIQMGTGCRIKSGMTELAYLIARLIPSL